MTSTGREIIRPRWCASQPPDIRQHDTIRFADLADLSFHGISLRHVTFFGCRLNGASFVGGDMVDVRFVGCFASEHGQAVSFGASSPRPDFRHTHLGNTDFCDSTVSQWPERAAELAWRAIVGNNTERYRAVVELGETGYAPVGPFLVTLVTDDEWDVRSAALRALGQLRGDGFPDDDGAILHTALEALGDENSLVSTSAVELVESVDPPLETLAHVVGLTRSGEIEQILSGLRAVVALCAADDPHGAVAKTFDGMSLVGLLQSPVAVIRAEYLHALGAANTNIEAPWLAGLRDGDPGVRARAVSALRLLDEPPPARLVEPLVQDPAEEIRVEALFTLGQLGGVDRAVVSSALSDPSERVRRYAAMLLSP